MTHSRVRLTLAWFFFTFGLLSLAWAGEPQWVEVRSPHFSVVTDAGEKRGHDTVLKFEQMRAVFGALLTKAKVNLAVPLQIIAFRNTKEFRQFVPLWHGKPIQLAGLFQAGQDRSFIVLDMSVEDPWTVVFHEYAHQLLNGNIQGETQPWFDEGFAEYFSTIEVDSKQAKVGMKAPPGDVEVLQQYSLMKVSDLFRIRHDSQAYNEGDRRSVFYAQSWLLVHYLYDTQQMPKLMAYFADIYDKKMSIEDAVQHSFGMSTVQLDKVLQSYRSAGRIRYTVIPTPAGIETTGYATTALSSADAKAVLADLHLHSQDYQAKALEEFGDVLKMQANHPAALRGLGYAYLQQRDFARAGEYFRKAADADSKDARVHYYSALLTNEEGTFSRDPDQLAAMRKELETSIALDPSFADAYGLLAIAYASSGEHERAVDAMKKAVELSPRNENYLYNLSLMYLSAGKVDDAIPVLRALQNSSDPQVAMRAQQSLTEAQRMKEAIAAGGQFRSSNGMVVVERVTAQQPPDAQVPSEPTTKPETIASAVRTSGPPKFLKGKLVRVDCSAPPAAVLSVVSASKTWKMRIADSKHAIVIGADEFSCAWTNLKVALNYHETGDSEGSVMSIEIQ